MNIKLQGKKRVRMSSESIQARYDFGFSDGRYDLFGQMIKSAIVGVISGCMLAIGFNIFRSTPISATTKTN